MKLKPDDIFNALQDAKCLGYSDNFIFIARKAIIQSIPTELVDWPEGVSEIERPAEDIRQHIGKIGLVWDSHRGVSVAILMDIQSDKYPYRVNLIDSNGQAIHNRIVCYANFRPGGIDLPGWNMDGTRKEEQHET